MTTRSAVAIAALMTALATVTGAASAQETDRVQVGVPGRNTTRGFSPALFVTVTTLPDFRRRDAGHWEGPVCEFAPNPNLSAPISMTWDEGFSDSVRTAETAARANLTFNWRTVESGSIAVPHMIRGGRVGVIPGFFVLTDAESQTGYTRARSASRSAEACSQASSSGRAAMRCSAPCAARLWLNGTASRLGGPPATSRWTATFRPRA